MRTKDNLWTVYSFKLAECPEQKVQWVLLWFFRFFTPIYATLCRPHKTCSTCMCTALGVVSGCFKNEVLCPFVSYLTSNSEARQPDLSDSEEHTGLKKKVQNFWKLASSVRSSERAGEWVSQSFNNVMAEKCYPEYLSRSFCKVWRSHLSCIRPLWKTPFTWFFTCAVARFDFKRHENEPRRRSISNKWPGKEYSGESVRLFVDLGDIYTLFACC